MRTNQHTEIRHAIPARYRIPTRAALAEIESSSRLRVEEDSGYDLNMSQPSKWWAYKRQPAVLSPVEHGKNIFLSLSLSHTDLTPGSTSRLERVTLEFPSTPIEEPCSRGISCG